MIKTILILAIACAIVGCGVYKNDHIGIRMDKIVHPVSDSLDDWGEGNQRVPHDFLAKIVNRWGRGEYKYFAQRMYADDGTTVTSYKLTVCKTLATGKDKGAPLGCVTAEGKSGKEAFDNALAKEMGP